MQRIDDTDNQRPDNRGLVPPRDSLKDFLIKVTLTLVLIVGALKVVLPDLSELKKIEKNEIFKLFALSLVQNPRVLWKLSEMEESKQNYEMAISYMDTAIGLMELHSVDAETAKRYQTRLKVLQDKAKGS